MKNIIIQDPAKGKIKYVINDAMEIDDFNKKLEMASKNFKMQKNAEIIKDTNKASGYCYINKSDHWDKNKQGFVYTITFNDKIVKIGMTEKTISSRFSSYQAGTLKARTKGTCSVTNYYCSESIRQALNEGMKVDIYSYNIPTHYIDADVIGKNTSIIAKQAYAYEDRLLEIYKNNKGEVPSLCRNTSLA